MDDLSVCPYARTSVCPLQLWKGGGSDPHAVWHRRLHGSRNEANGGVWRSVHGKGYFWGRIRGARLYPMATSRRTCATVPQPSKLQFWVVCAVGQGLAVLYGGQRRPRRRKGFWGFVLHSHNRKCHWVADGEMFPIRMRKLHNISANISLKSSICGLFGNIFCFKIKVGFMRN